MIDKLKNLDLDSVSADETNNILNEMLSLNDDDLKECLFVIIDSISFENTETENIEKMSPFYKKVFENEKVKEIMQEILDNYEKDI